jgi:hypothetical protein
MEMVMRLNHGPTQSSWEGCASDHVGNVEAGEFNGIGCLGAGDEVTHLGHPTDEYED